MSGRVRRRQDKTPRDQDLLSGMAHQRLWFWQDRIGWKVGGGAMHDRGRCLVLAPTDEATPGTPFTGFERRNEGRRLGRVDGVAMDTERTGDVAPRVRPSRGQRPLLRWTRLRIPRRRHLDQNAEQIETDLVSPNGRSSEPSSSASEPRTSESDPRASVKTIEKFYNLMILCFFRLDDYRDDAATRRSADVDHRNRSKWLRFGFKSRPKAQ